MSITAGAASDKISELRSKLAIYNAWVQALRNNYLSSDGGGAEDHITREDGTTCSEVHFHAAIVDIEAMMLEVSDELQQWEGLVFEPKGAQVTPIKPAVEADATKRRAGARRIHTAAKQPG